MFINYHKKDVGINEDGLEELEAERLVYFGHVYEPERILGI
jgi:hypothetical protein